MEETDTSTTTKVSDSAYSNSCNSKSQRSSESSKSRLSNSSGSSGYGDNPSTLSSRNDVTPQDPEMKRIKKKEHKKKKHKGGGCNASEQETIISSEYSCSSHKVLGTSREGPNCPDSDHHPGHRTGVAPRSDIHKTDQRPSVDPASVEKTPQNQVTRQVQELLTPSQCPPSNTYSCVETCVNKFSAGVSMQQGTVIYTTGPLTDILGFPEDMWVGRSFIDFVHPKDRTVLTSFITARVANIISSSFDSAEIVANKDLIFCSLRQYRGLRSSGFGVTEKKVTYLPFQLTLNFIGPAPGKEDLILLVTATPVTSIYKCPDELHTSSKFVTHQLADMSLSHVDPEVVTHMGYFPQDMLNCSIFDFYHPEDLPFFKEVYQKIMKKKGPPFRSKPYRFRVHNGCFVIIETEWSSFVNPWSKKLELIVGQHSILKGPTNPDVFAARPDNTSPQISEELLKQSKVIQDEIICLLTEMVVDSVLSPKLQLSKRCKDMATFMESLMGEVSKIDLKVEEQNISEKGSVTLGGISLHNANCDNTTSTDTPPSYNQLNYNDNIQRFFESRPKTTPSVGSRELKTEMNKPLMIPINVSKCSASRDSTLASSNNRKCCAPLNNTIGGSNSSDRAAIIHNGTNTSHVSYKPPHLTEAILWRHNEHMEKKMVQKHQEQLSKGDHRETESKKCQQLQTNNNQDAGVHGVKRSGSHSWEGKPFKGSKHPHVDGIPEEPSPTTNMPPPLSHWPTAKMTPLHQGPSNINLLPPFSVTMTPLHPTIPVTTNSYSTPPPIYPHMTNMIPLYYFPSGVQPQENPETPPISVRQPSPDFMMPPVSYMNMPGIMYPGMMQPIYQGSLMYQPNMVMLHPAPVVPAVKTHVSSPAALFHYPMFLATPPIAEPRSNFGNIAPASINKSMLEKEGDKEWNLSQEEGDKKYSLCTENETSYSSFYSFLKTTDKSDESMEENSKSEDMAWDKTDARGGKKARPVLRDPPWMEGVFVNPDLVYRYKLDERIMADILQADLKALNKTHQPLLVNSQLTQLYEDMEEEGLSKDCLEESLPSSSSSGEDSNNHPFTQPSSGKVKKKRRSMEYSKLVMMFEENAPLPPPSSQ